MGPARLLVALAAAVLADAGLTTQRRNTTAPSPVLLSLPVMIDDNPVAKLDLHEGDPWLAMIRDFAAERGLADDNVEFIRAWNWRPATCNPRRDDIAPDLSPQAALFGVASQRQAKRCSDGSSSSSRPRSPAMTTRCYGRQFVAPFRTPPRACTSSS